MGRQSHFTRMHQSRRARLSIVRKITTSQVKNTLQPNIVTKLAPHRIGCTFSTVRHVTRLPLRAYQTYIRSKSMQQSRHRIHHRHDQNKLAATSMCTPSKECFTGIELGDRRQVKASKANETYYVHDLHSQKIIILYVYCPTTVQNFTFFNKFTRVFDSD